MALGYHGSLHPCVRPPRVVPEEDVRHPGRSRRRSRPTRSPTPSSRSSRAWSSRSVVRGARARPPTGVLVDEQFGSDIPVLARAMPEAGACRSRKVRVRKTSTSRTARTSPLTSKSSTPDFSKVLVRYNPDGDADMNKEQLERLKRLADWLHANGRRFLYELPAATDGQLGAGRRHQTAMTPSGAFPDGPSLIDSMSNHGIRVDVWNNIEGVETQKEPIDAAHPRKARAGNAKSARSAAGVSARQKVDHWLRQAAPVEGFIGFAIGRSIWWDASRAGQGPLPRGRGPRRQLHAVCLRLYEGQTVH